MYITILGFFIIPIAVFLTTRLDLKQLLLTTFVCSTFSATAIIVFDFIGFALTIGQLFGMLLLIKLFILVIKKQVNCKVKINKWIYIFMILCVISLTYPLFFSKGTIVLTPDDSYLPIKFKFQMITQFSYLLFGFFIFWATCVIYKNINFKQEDYIYASRIILWIFNVLLVLQYIMPIEIYNMLFRMLPSANNQLAFYGDRVRLSGPTSEPSILSLTIVPIMGILIFNINKKNWKLDTPLILITLWLVATTKSSTFIIGLFVQLLCLIVYYRKDIITKINDIKINNKKLIIYILGMVLFVSLIFYLLFKDIIYLLLEKLGGQHASGSLRLAALKHHLNVFKQYPLFGVGFGTIRSYDLLSTWLSAIGLTGVGSYLMYILFLVKNLFRYKQSWIYIQFILVILMMMMVSVPEPYYLFLWIILGVLQVLTNEYQKKSSIINT